MNERHVKVFWDLIDVLDSTGFLSHVMIIGSWAEYLYPHCLGPDYIPNLKTRDVDVYYGNPFLELPGAPELEQSLIDAGFIPSGDTTGRKTFFKESVEVEFLSQPFGSHAGLILIPDTTITAETLRDLSVLDPLEIQIEGYCITVPTPSSYVVHKLLINPTRKPESKKQKDIEAVRLLLRSMSKHSSEFKSLQEKMKKLSPEQRDIVLQVAEQNAIQLQIDS